jgi:hypothetical protein
MQACAEPARPHGWIDDDFVDAHTALHRLGWAHSVEAWAPAGELSGGVYGVAMGGLFVAESMFHRVTDAGRPRGPDRESELTARPEDLWPPWRLPADREVLLPASSTPSWRDSESSPRR